MSLVAFIIGAGSNVGGSVAKLLKQHGYAVAVGSRNPDVDGSKKEGFHPVVVDASSADSIQKAFAEVNAKVGAVNVVVYNAASFSPLPTEGDPLSLSLSAFSTAIGIGSGIFPAAQQALAAFRSPSHSSNPKAFIVTGNILPFRPTSAAWTDLGIQKTIEARLVDLFAKSYEGEGIRFYFASLVSEKGEAPPYDVFLKSGPTHAKVYWELINSAKQGNSDHRFTPNGKKFEGYD